MIKADGVGVTVGAKVGVGLAIGVGLSGEEGSGVKVGEGDTDDGPAAGAWLAAGCFGRSLTICCSVTNL